jgi:pimeloyl-ACP methyl ester carboxylesterase
MQTATTLDGQVEELRGVVETHADAPVVLIGHSWGAWLSCIVAARYARLVSKLILIGSGPFEEKYVPLLRENRLQRLSPGERDELRSLARAAADVSAESVQRLGELAAKTYTFDAIETGTRPATSAASSQEIYAGVWPAAAELRKTGELLRIMALVECPVVAIHGSYDPHPVDGVRKPLERITSDFRMHVLERCGHDPWRERHAAEAFYALLEQEPSR